jgi:lysophospholipase L1-like esterase
MSRRRLGGSSGLLPAGPPLASTSGGSTPLGDATWSNGIYLDLRDADYDGIALQGDALATTLTPRIGAGVVSHHNGPTWDVATIGLRRTLKCLLATTQALEAHWLSALVSGTAKPFTVMMRFQLDVNGTRCIWGFGNVGAGTTKFIEGTTSSTNGTMGVRQTDDDSLVLSQTGGQLAFAPVVVAWVLTGTQIYQYSDVAGVMTLMAGFPKSLAAGATTVNQFRVATTARSTYGSPTDLHVQCVAITEQQLTQAQIQTVRNSWFADDTPAGSGTIICWYGDSITKGTGDSGEGGFRRYVYNNCVANSKAVDFQGSLSSGNFAEAQHSGYSSFEIAGVNNRITLELGTGNLYTPKYTVVMAGTNDLNNVGMPVPQALTDITTLINNLQTRGAQTDATHRIVLASVLDQQDPTGSANVASFNAGLPSIIATFNAANPSNQIIFWDAYTEMGAWSSTNFADGAHPNSTGYALIGNALYTLIASLIP